MANITCKCTAVHIELFTQTVLFRHECCCHDCTAALWYVHKRGGLPLRSISVWIAVGPRMRSPS